MNLTLPPLKDVVSIGGAIFTDPNSMIALYAFVTGTNNSTFRPLLTGGTAGYQVPAGKTLYIRACRMVYNSATSDLTKDMGIGYSDNDIGMNTATALTNSVSRNVLPFVAGVSEYALALQIPAQKFVSMLNNSAASAAELFLFGVLA